MTSTTLGAPRRRPRGQSLYTDLAVQVRSSGLLARRRGWYAANFAANTVAFVALWAAVVAIAGSWWVLALAVGLGIVQTQFGFLGHDAAHQQIFSSPRRNEWAARILAGAFAGLSFAWWRGKHHKHHANPNREGSDPDIAGPVPAFTPTQVEAYESRFGRWFVNHQGWLFFPLLTTEGINLHISGLRTLLGDGPVRHRRLELTLVSTRLTAYVVAVVLLLPAGQAALFFVVHLGVFGVCLGGSFAPNHKGMPLVPPTSRLDFLHRQVLTSRNVRGGLLVDFFMGGLNYQVEHHLFPSMPRPNLKRVQPTVREYCRVHDVPYTEEGLFASYGIVVDYLNHVGLRARGPFECPLRTDLRTDLRA